MNGLQGVEGGLERTFATGGIADCTDFSSEGGMEARGSTSIRSRGGAEIGAEFGATKSIKDWGNHVAGGAGE
jgi:hypothetical protein